MMDRRKHSLDRERKWEEVHVHPVLASHNKCYGTNIVIVGKAEEIYAQLKGQKRWDWVCRDRNTDTEFATEITNLTNELMTQVDKEMLRLLKEIRKEISPCLPGSFIIHAGMSGQTRLPTQNQRKLLKTALIRAVCEMAPRLGRGQWENLTPLINSMTASNACRCPRLFLIKSRNEGTSLEVGLISAFWGSPLEGDDFEEFKKLVRRKNCQLGQAQGRETILIMVEESHSRADAGAIERGFQKLV